MSRLGLWGRGSSFTSFSHFYQSVGSFGVSFLEMLSVTLKAEGGAITRSLAYTNATFDGLVCPLDEATVAAWDASAALWARARTLAEDIQRSGSSRSATTTFFGAQSRFYRGMCSALKVPTIVEAGRAALARGECVVIGLQSTGETVLAGLAPGDRVPGGLPSTARETLLDWLARHVPPEWGGPTPVKVKGKARGGGEQGGGSGDAGAAGAGAGAAAGAGAPGPATDMALEAGPPDELAVRKARYAALVADVEAADLPPAPLDALVDAFGVEDVAEMTGRSTRVVRRGGGFGGAWDAAAAPPPPVYVCESRTGVTGKAQARAGGGGGDDEHGDAFASINIIEARSFQAGRKRVAIISEAASTGVSLHASLASPPAGQRRRCHITLELAWAADRAIQQLGRTHRAASASAPRYLLAQTPLGGEARFAAALARRMQGLGALTRGDRRAAAGGDQADLGGAGLVDSPYGRAAVRALCAFARPPAILGGGGGGAGRAAADRPPPVLPEGVTLAAIAANADRSLRHLPASLQAHPILEPLEVGRRMVAAAREAEEAAATPSPHPASGHGGGPPSPPPPPPPGAPTAADLVWATTALAGSLNACLAPCDLSPGAGPGNKAQRPLSGEALIARFLNRILASPVAHQILAYAAFSAVLDAKVMDAKEQGTFDAGVADVSGQLTKIGPECLLWRGDEDGGGGGGAGGRAAAPAPAPAAAGPGACFYREVELDRGVSFEAACAQLERHGRHRSGDGTAAAAVPADDGVTGFYRSRAIAPGSSTRAVLLALARPGPPGAQHAPPTDVAITRPATGCSRIDMEVGQLARTYARYPTAEAARADWAAQHTAALHYCRHGPACKRGHACREGKRLATQHVVYGSIIRVWSALASGKEKEEKKYGWGERKPGRVVFGGCALRFVFSTPRARPARVTHTRSLALSSLSLHLPHSPGSVPGVCARRPTRPACPADQPGRW